MSQSNLERIREIFLGARGLTADDRVAFLKSTCGDDAGLRKEVEQLLAADAAAASTVERPESFATRPPSQIGPYTILGPLGEGGMGVVYKAEQRHPIRRIVALKVIRLGFDSKEVIARFESERQALARMDHPNIARVLDAGTDERGRPYFVMEYVPGTPITKYADENRLTIQQRLELMLQVCDAIGHAHAKAIIHRDIKAGNVLAYTTPDGPRVKVIDFGVAKALTLDRLTDRTFNTAHGQAIGTYESMSPEQADGSPDIDTRTDVYSLGVLLYELLSGSKPFDKSNLAKAADQEIRRIIREDEPPRPSTQLSSLGGNATKIAKARQSELEALTRQLKNELDWIPLMALRKERERRYATPQQLAEDIQNYSRGDPLQAAPDSKAYRLKKFVRRNRGPITIVATVMIMLVLGIMGTAIGLRVAVIREAEAKAAKLEAVNETKKTAFALEGEAEQRMQAERAKQVAVEEEQKTRKALAEAEQQRSAAERSGYFASISASTSALDQHQPAVARDWLNAAPASKRNWEWKYLEAQVDQSLAVIGGHETNFDKIERAQISSDGLRVFRYGGSKNADIRLLTTGRRKSINLYQLIENSTLKFNFLLGLDAVLSPNSKFVTLCFDDLSPIVVNLDQSEATTLRVLGQPLDKPLSGSTIRLAIRFVPFVVYSPDSSLILIADREGRATVWKADSGKKLVTFANDDGKILSAEFSPDSKLVATTSTDLIGRIWDVGSGAAISTLKFHTGKLRCVCFNPARTLLATASDDKTACIWEVASGKLLWVLRHDAAVTTVKFNPKQNTLSTISEDFSARLWDCNTGNQLAVLRHDMRINDLNYNPEGTQLVTSCDDKRLHLWDVSTGTELPSLVGHDRAVLTARYTLDGSRIVSVSADGVARVWASPQPGFRNDPSDGHDRYEGSVVINPQGTTLLRTTLDKDRRSGSEYSDNLGYRRKIRLRYIPYPLGFGQIADEAAKPMAFSPDGERVIESKSEYSIPPDGSCACIWDFNTGRELVVLRGHDKAVYCVNFSKDGGKVVTGSSDTTARIWDSRSGKSLLVLRGHDSLVESVQFDRDSRLVLTTSNDGTARLWDAELGTQLLLMPFTKPVLHNARLNILISTEALFSPDGRHILLERFLSTSKKDSKVELWDTLTGQRVSAFGNVFPSTTIALSHDGRKVLVTEEKAASLYDISGKLLATLAGQEDRVTSGAFSLDDSRVITASRDGTVWVWDTESSRHVLTLRAASNPLSFVRFGEDDATIIATSSDDAFVWDSKSAAERFAQSDTSLFAGIASQKPTPVDLALAVPVDKGSDRYGAFTFGSSPDQVASLGGKPFSHPQLDVASEYESEDVSVFSVKLRDCSATGLIDGLNFPQDSRISFYFRGQRLFRISVKFPRDDNVDDFFSYLASINGAELDADQTYSSRGGNLQLTGKSEGYFYTWDIESKDCPQPTRPARSGEEYRSAFTYNQNAADFAGAGNYKEAVDNEKKCLEIRQELRGTYPVNSLLKSDLIFACTNLSWYQMFIKDFTAALSISDTGLKIDPSSFPLQLNHAHALLLLNRKKEAELIYLKHRGEIFPNTQGILWENVVLADFAELEKHGVANPAMAEIRRELVAAKANGQPLPQTTKGAK